MRRYKDRIVWVGFVVATLLLVLNSSADPSLATSQFPFVVQLLLSPLSVGLVWWLILRYRQQLQGLVRRIPLPPLLKYVVLGSVLAAFVFNNFAISFNLNRNDIIKGDDPAILFNSFLWIGSFATMLLVYYLFAYRYRIAPEAVFWVSGLIGVVIEQNFLVPIMLATLNPFALIFFFALLPVYGATYGAIWLLMPPEQLPQGSRAPTRVSYVVLAFLAALAFYLGAALWWGMSDLLFGTRLLSEP